MGGNGDDDGDGDVEDRLYGRYLHTCVVCDGPSYVNRTVLVVGGGDSAIEAVRVLTTRYEARKIILVHRRTAFRSPMMTRMMTPEEDRVDVKVPYVVRRWITDPNDDRKLVAARLVMNRPHEVDGGGGGVRGGMESHHRSSPYDEARHEDVIDVTIDGAFVMIGSDPNTHWLSSSGEKTTMMTTKKDDDEKDGIYDVSIDI